MPTANLEYLDGVVGRLNAIPDTDRSLVSSPNDEAGFRNIIRKHIVPEFRLYSDETVAGCKSALQYFLTTGDAPFFRILSGQQDCPIEMPANPRKFFEWVWSELFPEENFLISIDDSWKVTNDSRTAPMYINPELYRQMLERANGGNADR
jgi:hypothetical protein